MDKKMIYSIINLPNAVKNKSKNILFLENNLKNYTASEEEILHRKRYIESQRYSRAIQLATKFYITNDYINFVEDNKINFYEIKEFANYTFRKPFENRPLLIQLDKKETCGVNLLIDYISGDIQNGDLHFGLKCFFYHNKNIVCDINDWVFSKDIFKKTQKKEQDIFYNKKIESLKTNSYPSQSKIDEIANYVRTTLHFYFAATYLKDILPIFETKQVNGRKPFVSNINTNQNIINLPSWEHKIISIKPNVLNDMGYNKKDKNGKRLHDVRGHFRRYSNGKISWIKSHKRGDASLGIITKDYKLNFKEGQTSK